MDVRVQWDCAMLFRGFTPEATTMMMDAHPDHGGINVSRRWRGSSTST